ncbi:helix-turn-helix domain-containing protein [Adlercreutzia shanghongiae]|uniref:Helix-turn-helix transcriptional regulator n=1 Tax=Adlercreutzia shanghongiae TaxID=3111773 RepID=A0ABU6J0P9_9ACTN|nr:helix-turn-helix transcriptional regulator [Adlercreutzia sp. R22]MEC4295344.1 helix-turn-helix transcriptional regulator [Adlercreutzia sp. R22]
MQEDRRALLKGGRRYICAYGCARAWATLTFTGATAGAGVLDAAPWSFDPHLTFDLAFIAVSILLVLLFRRFVPLNENRVVKAVSFGCMAAASLLCVAAAWVPEASFALVIAGSLAAGVGYGLFLLLAVEVLVTFSLLRIFLFLSGAMVLGSVITFFCEGLVGIQAQAMLVLLPVLAAACLQSAYDHVPAADRPKRGVPKFSYPWKLFVLYGLYAFAYGMRANQLVAGAGRHSSASTFILMAVLFATAYFASKRFNIGLLYRSPVVLMVCGFLLVPAESLLGTAASSYLIAISYSLMSFLVMFLLFDIAKRLGVAIVAFMAVKNAEQLLQMAGGGLTDGLGALGLPASTEALVVTVVVSVLILAATVLLFSEKELASKWGVSILDTGGLIERTAEEERAAERVNELSRTYRLSPREQEVLALLAAGKTGRVIQQELFIAEGTFKAHTRHIYEKMGINSRKELFDLLGISH